MLSIKSATTQTASVPVETGEPWYEQVKDGGDVRDHECRGIPGCSGGDHWGKQLPISALGCGRM